MSSPSNAISAAATSEGGVNLILHRAATAALIGTMILVALIPHLPSLMHMIIIPDFTMLWTGGRFAIDMPSQVYDVESVTAAQAWIRDAKRGPLPFIYPPTALLLIVPFGLLPFWPSFILWTVVGATAFWVAASLVSSRRAAALALLSPPAVTVLMLGQTTLLVGAAVLASLAWFKDRPILSGVLMGVAAAIKPQSAFLAPVAYLACRNWTAMVAAAGTWLLIALMSLGFGPTLWLDWLAALPDFPGMIAEWKLDRYGATPSMLARFIGADPTTFFVAGLLAGIAAVWVASKSEEPSIRALGFVGGTLIASPYAMNYEVAIAAPMLVAALLTTTLRGLVIAMPLVALRVYAIVPAVLLSLTVTLWPRRANLNST